MIASHVTRLSLISNFLRGKIGLPRVLRACALISSFGPAASGLVAKCCFVAFVPVSGV